MYYSTNVGHNGMAEFSPEVIVKGFKKNCISNVVDGTDDVLWNCGEEDGNVRIEREEDEGTDCEDGDSDTDW
jgi:hypothetical protein